MYLVTYTHMTLTKNDLQAIGSLIENRVRPVIKEEINMLRAEMHEAFRKQAESLSRAITDAVKMMADKQTTEAKLQELEDEVEDLKKQMKELQTRMHTTS